MTPKQWLNAAFVYGLSGAGLVVISELTRLEVGDDVFYMPEGRKGPRHRGRVAHVLRGETLLDRRYYFVSDDLRLVGWAGFGLRAHVQHVRFAPSLESRAW